MIEIVGVDAAGPASLGAAERALEMMIDRLSSRIAFGAPLSTNSIWHERIANSRCLIDQARLLTLNAAWKMDTVGNKAARAEIAMIKVVAPNVSCQVIDWAIQAHGAAGVCQDFKLAQMYAHERTVRIVDGPDEVHRNAIAKIEDLLPKLQEMLGLTITCRRTETRAGAGNIIPYAVEVVAMDHPGIVHDITNFVSERNINVEDLYTTVYQAPHTGAPMFSLHMTVAVPGDRLGHRSRARDDLAARLDRLWMTQP